MPAPSLVLLLAPTCLEGAVVRNRRIAATYRVDLGDLNWEDVWAGSFQLLDDPLRQIMRALDVRPRARTFVAYASPTSIVEAFHVPASGRAARTAAVLSLTETAGEPLDRRPIATRTLWTRPAGPESSVMACTDTDHAVQSIHAWLHRADLRPAGVTPARAVTLGACVRRTLEAGEPAVTIHLSERTLTIAAAGGGRLSLVRQVALGVETFMDAYARAFRAARPDHPPPSRDAILTILLTHGVPSRDTVLDDSGEFRGQHVLPLIQPVIQRLAVEIKQTLRFGLESMDPARCRITLAGLGARIPSLAALIGESVDAPIDTVSEGAAEEESDLALAARFGPGEIALVPRAATESLVSVGIRRGALIGAAAAVAILCSEAGLKLNALAGVSAQRNALVPVLTELEHRAALHERAAATSQALARTEAVLEQAMRLRPDWAHALADVSACSSSTVGLTELGASYERGRPILTLRGFALSPSDATDSLRPYIAALAGRRSIESVEVGSTRLGQFDGRSARLFTLTLHLREAGVLANATEGD